MSGAFNLAAWNGPRSLGKASAALSNVLPNWFYQLALILIVFASGQAGYYSGQAFSDFRVLGLYSDAESINNPLSIIGTAGSAAATLLALTFSWRDVSRTLRWLLTIQIYIAISALWSNVLADSLVIIAKTVIYALAVTVIIQRISYRDLIIALVSATWAICLVGDLISFYNPDFSTSIGANGWRGLFVHKNGFSAFCLFIAIMIYPALFNRSTKTLAIATIPLLVITVILTQGKTSSIEMLAYMAAVTMAVKLRYSGASPRTLVRNITAATLLLAGLGLPILAIFIASGDVTFTGRVAPWAWFLTDISDRIVFGAGGYTLQRDASVLLRLAAVGFGAAADSSFVSIIYNLGIVGLILFLSFIIWCWNELHSNALVLYAAFALCSLIAFVVYGAMESGAQLNHTLPNMVLLMQMTLVERAIADGRRRSAPTHA